MPTHLKIEIETASRRLNTSSLGPTCQLRANRAFTPDSFSTGNPWPDFGSKDRLHLTEHFNALPASERCPGSPSALPPARVLGGLRIDFGEKCDCFDDVVGIQIPTLIHVKESKPLRTLQQLDQPSRRRSGEKATARPQRSDLSEGTRRMADGGNEPQAAEILETEHRRQQLRLTLADEYAARKAKKMQLLRKFRQWRDQGELASAVRCPMCRKIISTMDFERHVKRSH